MYKINFNKPTTNKNVIPYMTDALASQVSGDGKYTRLCSELLERELGVARVLLTTSGTHALELAALLFRPEYAIMSTFTFSSTANAFLLHGAQVILVDIDDCLNMDVDQAIYEIRADSVFVPMHYAGVGCDMDRLIAEWQDNDNLLGIVEDNAHGLFGKYRGKYLGTFGELSALSFHETKNFTMGGGGALLINDDGLVEKAEIIREKGTNRTQFKRGATNKYSWVDLSSSYLPSDTLAAQLYAQLENWKSIQIDRWRVWKTYHDCLCDWAEFNGVQLPHIPAHCNQSCHMFYLVLPDHETRERFIREMAQAGVMTTFHYIPLHLSPMGGKLGYRAGQFPIAERVSGCLARLPFYTDLSLDDQQYVIEQVRRFKV